MSVLWSDLRFAARLLLRNPVFTVSVTLLLAVGIGANTLIFSMVDALLLRPLPVKNPQRLVRLVELHPNNFVTWTLPRLLYEKLGATSATLTDVICEGPEDVAFENGSVTTRIRINSVSPDWFSSLGIAAHLGRVLTPQDDRDHKPVAVISHDFWRNYLHRSPSILGQVIRLNGITFSVVGVLPQGVNGLAIDTAPDIRIPLSAERLLAANPASSDRNPLWIESQIFARLRPGTSLERAAAELEPLLSQPYEEAYRSAFPKSVQTSRNSRFELEPISHGVSTLRTQFSRGLVLLTAGVGLLLLMACANVACLLLTRSTSRSHEIGIRLALGAGAIRIVRQLLTESFLLALLGGALGLLLSYLGRPLLLSAFPPIRDRAAVLQPLAIHVDLNGRVLAFAFLVTTMSALFFGLWPAVRSTTCDLATPLRGARTTTTRLWSRNLLVVAQVSLCVVLLAGASLLVRSFARLSSMNPGFDRDHLITFTIDPGLRGYKPDQARLLSRQLLEKARQLPGVASAAIASRGLMRGTGIKATFEAAGHPVSRDDFLNSSLNTVTPGYFDTMGMHVVAGRDFTSADDFRKQKPVRAMVNQAFVRHFFPHQDPLGKLFGAVELGGLAASASQIIGVVTDAKYRSLREPIPPTVYNPGSAGFEYEFILHLRTRSAPASFITPVRKILHSLDPQLPFIEVAAMRQDVSNSLWQERLLAWLSGIFSALAILLAGLGLYGVLDFAVRIRTREIGIRIAVGASPSRLIRLLSAETLVLVTAGIIVGLAFYAFSLRWIRLVLYDVAPSDPWAVGSTLLFLPSIALFSIALPLWRAVRTDPATALRDE